MRVAVLWPHTAQASFPGARWLLTGRGACFPLGSWESIPVAWRGGIRGGIWSPACPQAQPLGPPKQTVRSGAADTQISMAYCLCGRLGQLRRDTRPLGYFPPACGPFQKASARAEVYFSSEITPRPVLTGSVEWTLAPSASKERPQGRSGGLLGEATALGQRLRGPQGIQLS